MIRRVLCPALPALILMLGSCEKKVQSAPQASVEKTSTPNVVDVPTQAPVRVILTPEERAAKLGFVKHLPQDTEAVISYYHGDKVTEKFKSTALWKLVQQGMGMDETAAPADPAAAAFGPVKLFDTEFTLAFGKSTTEQLAALIMLNNRSTHFNIRDWILRFAKAAKVGGTLEGKESFFASSNPNAMRDLLEDPEAGIGLVEKLRMPPIYVAFKVKESDKEAAAQLISAPLAMANMLGAMVAPTTATSNGFTLNGIRIIGSKVAETMKESREELDKSLTPALAERLFAALAKNDLYLMSGSVGDYVVFYMGASAEDFIIAPDVSASLCKGDSLAFADVHASKELTALTYEAKSGSKSLINSLDAVPDFLGGLQDGIDTAEDLGDTRDLSGLIRLISERYGALKKFASYDATQTVAYFEDGLKIESLGGHVSGLVDYKASNRLVSLADSPDTVLFLNFSGDPAYQQKFGEYSQSLFELVTAMTLKFADSPIPVPLEQVEKYREKFKLFGRDIQPELLKWMNIYQQDFAANLGEERAWVVDLKGTMPKVPDVSESILNTVKVPRVSWVSAIRDRAQLSDTWTKMNASSGVILSKVSGMLGKEIPQQEPLSSEKNGAITWFFALPFVTNDFLPSVTLNDQWLVASSSKNQALDLLGQAATSTKTQDGLYFKANFKALGEYFKTSLEQTEANATEWLGKPLEAETLKALNGMIPIFKELDSLIVRSRLEAGRVHTSIHFKTR